ncbi:hypothetical protein CCZ28_03195 [Pseudomonas oryzihabitans]|nr:hypothetical protein CCZ28_03195 [Pseudomonas psychrotolerans]
MVRVASSGQRYPVDNLGIWHGETHSHEVTGVEALLADMPWRKELMARLCVVVFMSPTITSGCYNRPIKAVHRCIA